MKTTTIEPNKYLYFIFSYPYIRFQNILTYNLTSTASKCFKYLFYLPPHKLVKFNIFFFISNYIILILHMSMHFKLYFKLTYTG